LTQESQSERPASGDQAAPEAPQAEPRAVAIFRAMSFSLAGHPLAPPNRASAYQCTRYEQVYR
jgi:hypothetical protein